VSYERLRAVAGADFVIPNNLEEVAMRSKRPTPNAQRPTFNCRSVTQSAIGDWQSAMV